MIFEKMGKQMDDQWKRMTELADSMAEKVRPKKEDAAEELAATKAAIRMIISGLGDLHIADSGIFLGKNYSKEQLRRDLLIAIGESPDE